MKRAWKYSDLAKKTALPKQDVVQQVCAEAKARKLAADREQAEKERQEFIAFIRQHTGIELTPEYRFHPERLWRFDFCSPEFRFYIEIDGGVFSQGRHTRGSGFIEDQVKRNEAVILGWRPIHIIPDQRNSPEIIDWVKRLTAA